MSKPVLATLLLMLQDEGLLSVDDPVEKYLPEFKELKTVDGKPARITIRHLLTHSSGMGEITPDEARGCKTLADVIPLYVAKPVRFTPGSKWVYCQSGINTGGRIAEVVTGEPLDKLLQRRLFDPLGMKDTTFYLTEEQLPRLAKSYRRTNQGSLEAAAIGFLSGKSPTSRDRFPAPNGGLFSTASDYARFCQMVLRGGELDGKRYLKPETVKLMTTIQTGGLKTGFTEGNGWGLGWCVVRQPQGVTAMLSPGTFGHGGVYGTQAWIDPKLQRIYILMVQRANFPNSNASEVRRGFQEAASAAFAHATRPPQAEIDNGLLKVQFYLPDAQNGFYRGTRFDWSGVIGSLEYKGHRYYGPWFTKTDPTVNDFIYQGADIIAGPCSAITGPVEEFSTDDKALGYEKAKPGGTFIKIGVGVLRKPPEGGRYNRFRLYEIVDPGTWRVQTTGPGVTFTHDVADPSSGYGYRYEKTIQLVPGRPEMVMDHRLMNTGKRAFASSVYNHNFLVLDGQPSGPDFVLQLPFEIKTRAANNALAAVRDNQIVYRKTLRDKETVFIPMQGFGPTAEDYRFTIENKKTGAGLKITGDRPLSNVVLWSIRSVLSLEPFLTMSIEPGQEFTWKYTYTYYVTTGNDK
jgi:CubicO group peptidase (beta-lactamase class C family)